VRISAANVAQKGGDEIPAVGSRAMQEQSLFIEALEKGNPAERAAFLDCVCADDPELRRRIERLLQRHNQDGNFLESPVPPLGATVDEPIRERPGVVIGPYKLLEQIGEGGFGTVWMAQQTEPVRRLVAVKLIQPGMDSRQVLARFEAERQALALMDHPNIARVLDAGATATGRPFFVMELVKGVPLTEYCDERRLTPKERLELFVGVCRAVQHAHQKGIIHRDLKPTNVLVASYDGKPVPKVIDFGIAKAAGQQLTEKTLVTGFGAVMGTLEYMSPEQAELNQLDIDTRSDVFSLGVLLYELLVGTTPLERMRLKDAGLLEALRLIREEEPPRPSTRLSTTEQLPSIAVHRGVEPKKLSGLVRGELDWIVMKALEKDRNRRYETANGLALDVQRYLNDEAVLACPPSAAYRLGKFARRHKAGLGVGSLVLVCIAVIGGSGGWLARDQASRRWEAEGKAAEVLQAAEPLLRESQPRNPALTAAAQRLEALLDGGSLGPEARRRAEQFRRDVRMLADLDEIRLRQADSKGVAMFDAAGAEQRYAAAFAAYGLDMVALGPVKAAARVRESAIRDALLAGLDAWIQVKPAQDRDLLRAVADGADASAWRRSFREAALAGDTTQLRALAGQAEALAQPPTVLAWLGSVLAAAGLGNEADSILRQAQERYPGDFWINYTLGHLLTLGPLPPRPDEAVGYCRAAVALRLGSAEARSILGVALLSKGDTDGAIAAYRQAIALDPEFAIAHTNLGNVLAWNTPQLDEAIAEYHKAIELDPKYATGHFHLANALSQQGKLDEAIAEYQKAIDFQPDYAEAHCNLGHVLRRQGDFAKALEELRLGHRLGSKNSAQWVRDCERLLELDGRLPDFLAGKVTPASADERIELAQLCYYKQMHRAGARFYGDAFAVAPKLAGGLNSYRYKAACTAALAGCGQGKDADKLDEKEKARLRGQALGWLRAELEAMGRLLDKGTDKTRATAANLLWHWQVDPDLAGVRGPEALARLPETERQAWQKLWEDVADLLNRALAKTTPPKKAESK
jgi:serine/threonine protein kinase/tetratricopeptide (TPR) repeat protein